MHAVPALQKDCLVFLNVLLAFEAVYREKIRSVQAKEKLVQQLNVVVLYHGRNHFHQLPLVPEFLEH